MSYELAFLKALLFTVLLEVIAVAALKKFFGRRLGFSADSKQKSPSASTSSVTYLRLAITVALASMITLPYVWFILPAFIKPGITYIVTAEVSVTILEALWYAFFLPPLLSGYTKLFILKVAFVISIVANGFSYFIGNILF